MLKKALLWMIGAVIVVVVVSYVAFKVSPWPSALFFRHIFDKGGIAMAKAMEKHVPAGVAAQLNEHYVPTDGDAFLDVFYPSTIGNTKRTLPTIAWVHGGGFISGSKDQIASYLEILAANGFTTVGVNYSLAPGEKYPTPVRQVNAALAYLVTNAQRLHIDDTRLFLAGDSAGAQIAAQVATVISLPPYAQDMGIAPSISREHLRGVILYCGIYEPRLLNASGAFGAFLNTVSWSYFGTKDFQSDPRMAQFSVIRNVSAQFPPMFISAGNSDPLGKHSHLLATTAASRGVPVDSLFFPADYAPPLSHEYQFDLDTAAGQTALDRSAKFLAARSH